MFVITLWFSEVSWRHDGAFSVAGGTTLQEKSATVDNTAKSFEIEASYAAHENDATVNVDDVFNDVINVTGVKNNVENSDVRHDVNNVDNNNQVSIVLNVVFSSVLSLTVWPNMPEQIEIFGLLILSQLGVSNGTAHFRKCNQLCEFPHLILLRDI